MPSQHKYRPITFRPPESDRAWLLDYAASTGRAVNAILAAALAEFRARHSGTAGAPAGKDDGTATTRRPRSAAAKSEPEGASDIIAALRRPRNGEKQ